MNLTVLLRTRVAFNTSASQFWSVSVLPPQSQQAGATAALTSVGALLPWRQYNGEYQWRLVVPGSLLQQAGNYTLYVFFGNSSVNTWSPYVWRNGSTVAIYPGPPAAQLSSLQVSPLANTTAVGSRVGLTLSLADAFGNPTLGAANVSVALSGNASRLTVVPGTNFTGLGGGRFRYVHTLEAQETLTLRLNVSGTIAAIVSLNVSAASLDAVALSASVAGAVVELYGNSSRQAVSTGSLLQGFALATHRVFVPVVRPTGQPFGSDPGLLASVALVLNGGQGSAAQLAFNGSWSGSNRAYEVFFRAPSTGVYAMTVTLRHPTVPAAQANFTMRFNASQPPLAVNGSLNLSTAQTRVGDWVFITVSLIDFVGQPAPVTTGVALTARGASNGNVTELPLLPVADSVRLWRARYDLRVQESLSFILSVAGTLVDNKTISVEGIAPSFLDLSRSLVDARLYNVLSGGNTSSNATTSGSASTTLPSAAVTSGAALVVAMARQLTLELPVYTAAGAKWLSDPGVSVVLSLVPSALEEDVTTTYAASLLANVRRLLQLAGQAEENGGGVDSGDGARVRPGGRQLLQTIDNTPSYNSSYYQSYGSVYAQSYDYPAYTGEFAGDNAAGAGVDLDAYTLGDEPRDPWAVGPAMASTPPLNADSLDGLSALQDNLTQTPGVLTFKGNFSTFKQSYQLSMWLGVSDTYLALLSVRHPALKGSLRLTRFLLTVMDQRVLQSTVNDTQWDASVNPLITLNVYLPAITLAAYPGGASSLLSHYRALVAGRAGVSSANNVRVWDLRVGTAAGATASRRLLQQVSGNSSSGGMAGVTLVSQIWFDADWATRTSGFSSMTSLEYFYFQLRNMPQPLLTDTTNYPAFNASGVKVTNISLSEPFASTLAANSTSSDVAGSAPTKATMTIIPLDLDQDPAALAATAAPAVTVPATTLARPPVVTLVGEPYVEVQEADGFTDPGAYAYDAVDGFGSDVRVAVRVCTRRNDMSALLYAINAAAAAASASGTAVAGSTVAAAAAAAAQVAPPALFTCTDSSNATAGTNSTAGDSANATSVQVYTSGAFSLNASAINATAQVYLLTYTAINSRRLAASPRYRAVVVQPRCNAAAGEFWCSSISACSVGRVCSAGLAAVSKALAASSAATTATSTTSASAAAAAAASVASAGAGPVAVVTTPNGGVAVVTSDGRTTLVDPLAFTRTSFASADTSDPNNYGVLGNLLTAASSTAAVLAVQPQYVRDALPPVISLLGSGAPALSTSGQAVMLDTVVVGTNWTDPGATAWDANDGNLTALLQSYGSAAVDTSRPTPAGSAYSYMVEYQVADLSGNVARPARRLILLVCPAGERYCTDATGLPACTNNGLCGSADLISSLILSSNATSSLAPASSADSSTSAASAQTLTITLVGPSMVRVVQGESYDRCSSQVPKDQPCDPGAVAFDAREGSLDLRVRICGVPLRATRVGQALLPLALACNASTSIPGTYTLTFTVANSAGTAASADRTLIVQPACPLGERLCPDNVTCSTGGGVCASSLLTANLAADTAAAAAVATATTARPTVSLITAPAAPALVLLPRGATYAPCIAGADLSAAAAQACEPGALAWSADGLNLTDRVTVCPPAECLRSGSGSTGCSADQLRRHTLAAKGLAGCAVNTLAPVGAVFYVDFWVWDDSRPPANATSRRTIVITEPCPEPTLPYFCSDGAGGYLCSPAPCAATSAFLPPVTPEPSITLLPSGGGSGDGSVVYVEFGSVSPVYLGPCASADNTIGCGAIASGTSLPTSPSGMATAVDLTPSLTVSSTTPCTPASGTGGCLPCSLEALAVAGSCLPGTYTFRYSVVDEQGRVATADRTVVVYQRATITATLTLLPGILTDEVAAAQLLSHLRNASHSDYADALQNVTARMSAFGVRPTDVDLLSASVAPSSPAPSPATPASLEVQVLIYLYNPSAVHRNAITGGATIASGRRRLGASPSLAPPPAPAPAVSPDMVARTDEDVARIWDRLAQQRWLDMRRQQRQAARALLASYPTQDAGAGDYGDAGMPGGVPGGRQVLRTLLLSSNTTNTTADSNSTASAAALAALVASVTSSLNATAASATVPDAPDLSTAYAAALASLASALAQSSYGVSADAATLSYNIETIMGEQADRAEAQRTAAQQDAFEALLAAASAAENRTLERAGEVEALMDAQVAAQAALVSQAADLQLTLTELSADTRAQTDRALYTAMVAASAVGYDSDVEAGPGCYRLDQNGFSVSFTISRFTPSAYAASNNVDANASASGAVGGRRQLLQSSRSGGGSTGSGGGGGSGGSSSGGYTSILPWLGYYITQGYSGQGLPAGVDLGEAAASMRPRHAGARSGNRVVGGMLLYTTRRPLLSPSDVSSTLGTSASFSSKSSDAPCGGGFSDLDARCHLYELAYMKGTSEASSMLQRLFGGVNNSVAPYGVDPVFLRSSPLYRADLTSKLDWYYNTSDSTQVGPTGTPYGFIARPLDGRAPGFPVLVEGGLSSGRAVDMVRYMMDGNYLDKRQTRDMSAEMLVYNPTLKAFAYFRGDFRWGDSGGIAGRFSTVGFPAMAYLDEGQQLADALPIIFAHELLPLWVLSVFFAAVTAVGVVSAAARAARHAAVAATAAAAEREAEIAAQKGFGPYSPGGGVSQPLMSPRMLATGDAPGAGAVAWAHVGPVSESAIHLVHSEEREAVEERRERSGTAGMSLGRAWFREFVRHDGGLLYDVPLAVLLIAVAAFWTAFVDRHLVLYDARSSYRVYDGAASASARWLMSARSATGVSEAAASNTSSLYTAASALGLSVPTAPGDPGRWLLQSDDADWDELNAVLQEAHRLVNWWTVYGMLQAVVIVALIAKLVGVLSFQARLGIICRALMAMAGPIIHLVIIIVLVVTLLAAASNTVLGERVGEVSTMLGALGDTLSLIVGGQATLDSSAVRAPGRIVSVAERVAAASILAVQVLLLLFVLFNFFFATMGYLFIKHKRSVDWAHAPTVPQDLARVVLPDLARRVMALMPGAAGRRYRRQLAVAAAARSAAAAKPAADSGSGGAAAGPSSAAAAGGGVDAPTNKELLRSLAAGGVDERMCAMELQKTWNGRVRATRMHGGKQLIDKATMRQIMLEAASTSSAAKLASADEKAAATSALKDRELAVTAARRVMERVGRTYGASTPEYKVLERAAEAEAAARRRQTTGAAQGEEEPASPGSSASPAPPQRSLSTEIQIHLSIYEALNAAVESIVRWQSGVHRWQVRTWKQMASAYLFNQQLLAGLGMAPGPAFVERPQALQDEDLPHVPRPTNAADAGTEPGQQREGGDSSGTPLVMPPWMRIAVPPAASGTQPRQPPTRPGSMVEDISGILSPSQLSVTEGVRRKASDGAGSPLNSARRRTSSPAVHPYPQLQTRVRSPILPPAPQEPEDMSFSPQAPQPPQPSPPKEQRATPSAVRRQTPLLDDGVSAAAAAARHTPSEVEELDEQELATLMNAAAMPALAPPWKPLSASSYAQAATTAATAAAMAAASAATGTRRGSGSGSGPGSGGGAAGDSGSYATGVGELPSRSGSAVHLPAPPLLLPQTRPASATNAPQPPAPPVPMREVHSVDMGAFMGGSGPGRRSYSYAPTHIEVVPEEEDAEGAEQRPSRVAMSRLRVSSDVSQTVLRHPPPQAGGGPPRPSGGVPVLDEMRERLMGLMRRRGQADARSAGGAPGTTRSSASGTRVSDAGSAPVVGGWVSGSESGAFGAANANTRDARDANMVHNMAYSSQRRPSLDEQPDAQSHAE